MARQGLAALLLLGWLGFPPWCSADVDPSEYERKQVDVLPPMSVEEQRRASAEADPFDFEQMRLLRTAEELQAESEQKKREAEAELKRQADAKAVWEALPIEQRLTAVRCTECHIANHYTSQRHNRFGWELVTLRMQYLNEAKLGEGERSMIAQHLTQAYPVAGADAVTEAILQILALLSPLGFWLIYRGARNAIRRNRKQHG